MKSRAIAFSLFLTVIVAGCDTGPTSAVGFSLPDGDVGKGKAAFAQLQCNTCHQVAGVEFVTNEGESELSVTLGGKVARIRTYGELVTSIINPSHRLARGYPLEEIQIQGQSRMTNYNDAMTVSQLIDLVAFLQSQYELREYEMTDYPAYW